MGKNLVSSCSNCQGLAGLGAHQRVCQGRAHPITFHWAPAWGRAEASMGHWSTGRLGSAGPMAGQGCGELEATPAAVLLGQGLKALGGC